MSTSRSRVMARAAVISAFASAAVFGLTGTASAHSGEINASCDAKTGKTKVSINLRSYNGGAQNTWEVTDNGRKLANGGFQEGHQQTWADQDGGIAHKYSVKVIAGDGPDNKDWSFTRYAEAAACRAAAPTTRPPASSATETVVPITTSVPSITSPAASTTPPTSTTAPVSTTAESVAPTTSTAPVPLAAEDDLADTGASIALPLVLGGVLVLGGAGALVAVRRRGAKS